MFNILFAKINKNLKSAVLKIGLRKLFIGLLVILAIITNIVLSVSRYAAIYASIYQERMEKIKYIADFAINVLDYQNSLVNKHQKTLSQAQNEAINIIKKVRFEKNDYIWINAYDGRMIYHHFPERIGTNIKNYIDRKNNPFGQKFIDVVNSQGSGYVHYYWPKVDNNRLKTYSKLSYVIGFKDEPGWRRARVALKLPSFLVLK